MDLDSMKYSDLRQLAKSLGLKANVKAEKLLKALKCHFEQQGSSENGNDVTSDAAQIPEEAVAEPKPVNDLLVTRRRGNKQQAKRKYSADRADPNPTEEESPVVGDTTPPGDKETTDGKRSFKRKKVSSGKDTETKPESGNSTVISGEESSKGVVKKPAGKIPRHEGLLKNKAALRPTTPNFKKLHEAHFNKMESIVSYMERKNKLHSSVSRDSAKDLKKPPISQASLFSPGVPEKNAEKHGVTRALASKPAFKDSAPFRPSIHSVNKVNVRFSQTTQDNEYKRSLVKTPARMSPMLSLTPTPVRKSEVNKNTASINKTPGLTPFIFSGASGTPATNKKSVFDLKASLSRPLSYKPHKGKLKPFGVTQENTALNVSQAPPSRQSSYKRPPLQTRDKRRVKHKEDRKQKKEKLICARRGLVSA